MTVKEARKIVAVLMVAYPSYRPIDTELAAKVWADTLEEYAYGMVSTILNAYIKTDTSGFAPTPGQLIDRIARYTQPPELNEMEAWSLVYRAICRSSYYSVEEFDKLPPLIQKAVGSPDNLREWGAAENLNKQVVSSQFMRQYRAVVEAESEFKRLPEQVKRMAQLAAGKSAMKQVESTPDKQALAGAAEKRKEDLSRSYGRGWRTS